MNNTQLILQAVDRSKESLDKRIDELRSDFKELRVSMERIRDEQAETRVVMTPLRKSLIEMAKFAILFACTTGFMKYTQ